MSTLSTDRSIRGQVTDIRNAIAAARDEHAQAKAERDKLKEAFIASGQDPVKATESEEFKAAEEAVKRVGELGDKIADLQATERRYLELLGGSEAGAASPDRNGPQDGVRRSGVFDIGGLLAGEAYQKLLADGLATSEARIGNVVLGKVADAEGTKSLLAGAPGRMMAAEVTSENMQGAIAADRRGIITPNLRPLRLLDLFVPGVTNSNIVEYVQVLTTPSAAAEWTEGTTKAEASFTTQDAEAPARTIAVWIKVRRTALADVGMLQSLLNTLLIHDVRRRLEDQMAAGDGVAPNILGLMNVDGLGAPDAVAGDNTADAILRAITTVLLSDGDPNFTAVHPLTWQDLLLMRENQAERTGAYLYGSPSMQVAPSIWGLPIVNSRAIPADEPLVGDSNAAQPLVREGLTVRISDSDQDDFVKNRVTILVETRVAFPIWRPTSFSVATVPGSGS